MLARQGALLKQGNITRLWRHRWAVLLGQRLLVFEKPPAVPGHLGTNRKLIADLVDAQVEVLPAAQKRPFAFRVRPLRGASITLSAATDSLRTEWVDAIVRAASGETLRASAAVTALSLHRSSSTRSWIGNLRVTVVEGCNMRAMDIGGKSDPFCIVSYGPSCLRTKIVRNELNPRWDEDCFLRVHTFTAGYTLTLTVYDHDKMKRNDFIGSVSVSPGELGWMDGGTHDTWLDVLDRSSRFAGQVHVRVQYRSRADLERVFWLNVCRLFDTEGSGYLERDEFAAMLVSLNPMLCEEAVERVVSCHTYDCDGRLTFDRVVEAVHASGVSVFEGMRAYPVTNEPLPVSHTDADIISYLGYVFEKEGHSAVNSLVTQTFLMEQFAAQKVRSSAPVSPFENPRFVLVMDRQTGIVAEEFIPPSVRTALRALYQSRFGRKAASTRRVQGLLKRMTEQYGERFSSPASTAQIEKFVRVFNIDMSEVAEPLHRFKTFNDFFYRHLKPSARPIAHPHDERVAVCCADSRCVVFPSTDLAARFWIKGAHFSLNTLLGSDALAARYAGGAVVVFRLAPQDYHRIHVPVGGVVGKTQWLGDQYFTVNPMAVRSVLDVLTENRRCVTELYSEHFGCVQYIAIGATMVGSIVVTALPGTRLRKGDELGYFAFGGSTVVVLFEPGVIEFDDDLVLNSVKPLETLVRMGQSLGRCTRH